MPLTRKSQVVFVSQLYCIFARRRSLFFLKSLNEAHEGRYETITRHTPAHRQHLSG